MGGGTTAGAVTVAVFLAAVAVVLLWKKTAPRAVAYLALAAGLTGASVVAGWLGNLATMQIYGAGVLTLFVVVGGIILWHELVKGRNPHRIRTPLIAFAWGVAVMSGAGAAGNLAHTASNAITSGVDHVTTTVTGHGPGG